MASERRSRIVRAMVWTMATVMLFFGLSIILLQVNAAAVVQRAMQKADIVVVEQGSAELDILRGDLTLHDWIVETGDPGVAGRSRAAIDTLLLRGVSKTALMVHGRFVADELVLIMDSLMWIARAEVETVPEEGHGRSFGGFDVRHARLRIGTFSHRVSGSPEFRIVELVSDVSGCAYPSAKAPGLPDGWTGSISSGACQVVREDQPRLDVADVRVDIQRRSIELHGITLGVDSTVERDAAALDMEDDVLSLQVDTMQITGISDGQGTDLPAWHAESIRISGARVHAARDKRLPDAPFKYVPLIAARVRAMPMGSGVDSIIFDRMDVTYHERAEGGSVFGRLPFHHIKGSITGAWNRGDSVPTIIHAQGYLFDTAYVRLDLRTLPADSTDGFTAEAWVRGMPFADLAAMMGPLTDVRPVGGWLRDVRMTMEGNDRGGRGLVRMRYDDLKLEMGPRRNRDAVDALGSAMLNAIVRKRPRTDAERDREGAFVIERRRDRSVFNMLWRGLREGARNIVLPELITKK